MAELQPPEGTVNGGLVVGASSENPVSNLGSKRQRRPSVRLGDIGEQPATLSYESYLKRSKQWNPDSKYRNPSHQKDTGKASKTRPLTNLSNGGDSHETLGGDDEKNASEDGNNLDLAATVVVGNRRGGLGKDFKSKRGGGGGGGGGGGTFGGGGGTKRVRSNWGTSKVDDGGVEGDERFSGGEDGEEWYRDFDQAGSESPLKEQQSPIHSLENTGADLRQTSDRLLVGSKRERRSRPGRIRVPEYRDHDAVELDGPSDTDAARDWKCRTSVDRNGGVSERGRCSFLEDGVQSWLNGLGLSRYAPVFEIHEVDEEVLPLLTLEDLRDMGINAVGSRRKMYCAIQKLAKGFS